MVNRRFHYALYPVIPCENQFGLNNRTLSDLVHQFPVSRVVFHRRRFLVSRRRRRRRWRRRRRRETSCHRLPRFRGSNRWHRGGPAELSNFCRRARRLSPVSLSFGGHPVKAINETADPCSTRRLLENRASKRTSPEQTRWLSSDTLESAPRATPLLGADRKLSPSSSDSAVSLPCIFFFEAYALLSGTN